MNIGEIAERLVQAAEIEEAAGRYYVGPQHARSLPLPYEHSWADRNGWGSARNKEESERLWSTILNRPSAQMISEAEEAWGWLALVADDGERQALAAWARCMANVKRECFKDWCFDAGIHPETGRRRKDRALSRIAAHVSRKTVQHSETGSEPLLLPDPENADIEATFPEPPEQERSPTSWLADDAFAPIISGGIPGEFSWAEKRNARRRQREARRKKQEKAAA